MKKMMMKISFSIIQSKYRDSARYKIVMKRIVSAIITTSAASWCSLIAIGAYQQSNDTNYFFQYHPPFMAFGFLFFMTSGLLAPVNKLGRKIHSALQIMSVVCGTTGVTIVIVAKQNSGEPHLSSTHSVIGIIAVSGLIVQFISGLFKYYRPSFVIRWHGLVGIATYLCGIGALLTACVSYLCGNITSPDVKGSYICKDADTDSIKYAISMFIPAITCIMLYVNKLSDPNHELDSPDPRQYNRFGIA